MKKLSFIALFLFLSFSAFSQEFANYRCPVQCEVLWGYTVLGIEHTSVSMRVYGREIQGMSKYARQDYIIDKAESLADSECSQFKRYYTRANSVRTVLKSCSRVH